MVLVTLSIAMLAVLPSLWPGTFSMLSGVKVDTDPENMLSEDEAVRVFHNDMKKVLSLHDMVVVGVVNETHPNGVFNSKSLNNIYSLTEFAMGLQGEEIGEEDPKAGVIQVDVIAPSTVDNIEQGGPGVVRFEWLMRKPPETDDEALIIREKARRIPFLDGTLLSEDGKALCLYLPLTSKDLSYKVYSRLKEKIATLEGEDRFFITGLPVAEDTFGVEMFIQMAISAPSAMLLIFILMMLFFRRLLLVISPLILALISVICTMGMLVITGNTIHIMSSLIPIFIMPIAVLDSIHILSEFFDRYQKTRDRRTTIHAVMDSLFVPMLYTSLTSAAGFASLALTPIPPVQVFGVFIAFGVMTAWFLTITFIPAFIMHIPEKRLRTFGASQHEDAHSGGLVGGLLSLIGGVSFRHAKAVLAFSVVVAALAVLGISKIQINDNPIKWFKPSHPIRVADRVLNEHFGGTYMAYLAFRPAGEEIITERVSEQESVPLEIDDTLSVSPAGLDSAPVMPDGLLNDGVDSMQAPETEAEAVDVEEKLEIFKRPETLRYIAALQEHLSGLGLVGKSNSLADIVKTVHRELINGEDDQFRIPDSVPAVAQCLMQYQSSHRPGDLWHFVTPDYRSTSIWFQLKSGDNKDTEKVVQAVEDYVVKNPPPFDLEPNWFGLTYINIIWQEKMVSGMLQAFLGSFVVVLLMMIVLFRSALWGLLSMIPLTLTIGLIYGMIGFIGKDYDMPVAVLSALTLGMAVDFAIHFLARSRALYAEHGSWDAAYPHVFGEPARAIMRNVIVIAFGFTPLLAAPLLPYRTVGIFLASILFISGFGTLVILPALIKVLEPWLFPKKKTF